jgi:hypothetical protein
MQELSSLKRSMHVSEVSGSEHGSGMLMAIVSAEVFVNEIQKGHEGEAAFHLFRPSRSLKRAFGTRPYLIHSQLPPSRIMEAVGQNHPLAKMLVS